MSQKIKRIQKLLNNRKRADTDLARAVLKDAGWNYRTEGSHFIYFRDGEIEEISIPIHDKEIKGIYVRRIIDVLKLEEEELW